MTEPATFGMVPRAYIQPGVKLFDTMDARSELVDEKRSFSGALDFSLARVGSAGRQGAVVHDVDRQHRRSQIFDAPLSQAGRRKALCDYPAFGALRPLAVVPHYGRGALVLKSVPLGRNDVCACADSASSEEPAARDTKSLL
jgi:hypothetical protein